MLSPSANFMIKFFMDGQTDVERMLEQEPERIVVAMLDPINEGTLEMADQARSNATGGVLQRRTGTLEESVQPQAPKVNNLTVDQDLTAGSGYAFYGRILEQGVDHGWLEENLWAGKPMAFETGGDKVFAALAEHPALPSFPWFYPILEETTPVIIDKVSQAITKELES
jgi:hypothetical protein